MKILRALALIGALLVVAFAARDFTESRRAQEKKRATAPEAISAELSSQSGRWMWTQTTAASQKIRISADGFRQTRDRSAIELTDVRLEISHEDEQSYDRVLTKQAIFRLEEKVFHAEGEVVITLGVPSDGDADESRLTRIVTSGATFLTDTGVAFTDRETLYAFDGGRGRSVGAHYDSARRLLDMKSEALVERFPAQPGGTGVVIRAGALIYHEIDQRVDLREGVTLVRGTQQVTALEAAVHLEDGAVRSILAADAQGLDDAEGRTVRFQAPALEAYYSSGNVIEHVVGAGGAELASDSPASKLRASGERIDLYYLESGGDGVLDRASIRGAGEVEAKPANSNGEIRSVSSPAIDLKMRPGGREVSFLQTLERGTAVLTPLNGGPGRKLAADRIRTGYAADNRMESLTASGSVEAVRHGRNSAPPLETWSDTLEARFEPRSGEMIEMAQRGSFRFVEGERRGEAGEAAYLPEEGAMRLESRAKVWDASGSVSAHSITLEDAVGRMTAENGVSTVYEERSSDAGAGLFSPSKPVYGTADRMVSEQSSGVMEYVGTARLWQGENRVSADRIAIDRSKRTLEARGAVLSMLRETAEAGAAQGELIRVRSESLRYDDQKRLAVYETGVRLTRSGMRVSSDKLDAELAAGNEGEGSQLRSAVAVGGVEILEESAGRQGFADRAVYKPEDDLVILYGDPAKAVNALGEETRGAELTYRINDDRLLVRGGESDRAYTFRRRDSR